MNDFMIHGSTQGNVQGGGGGLADLLYLILLGVMFVFPPIMILVFLFCLLDDVF